MRLAGRGAVEVPGIAVLVPFCGVGKGEKDVALVFIYHLLMPRFWAQTWYLWTLGPPPPAAAVGLSDPG